MMLSLDKKSVKRIKIDYTQYEWLKKAALTHLGITNLNHLRDMFEGQEYFNKFLTRSYGEFAVEKFLNKRIIDLEKKRTNKNYTASFSINGKKIALFSFSLGEFPKIAKKDFDIGIFILVNLDSRTAEIIGFLNFDSIVQLVDYKCLSPLEGKHNFGVFKTFDHLLSINELSL